MRNRPGNEPRLVAHLMNNTGHVNSTDCWCEPTYFWLQDGHDQWVFVVEHNDETADMHTLVLEQRGKDQDWVTALIESLH